jgi:uncharacterized membrane protein YtjA (UPF0391 family)
VLVHGLIISHVRAARQAATIVLITVSRNLAAAPALALAEPKEAESMLYWAMVFLIVAIIAGVLGFGGIAATAAGIAKVLFVIFLAMFVIALVMGSARRWPPPV